MGTPECQSNCAPVFVRRTPNDVYLPRSHAVPLPSSILDFYDGTAPDSFGKILNEVLSINAHEIGLKHWSSLFPVPEESIWERTHPIVNKEVYDAFHENENLHKRLHGSFLRALWWLGFRICGNSNNEVDHQSFKIYIY